MTTRGHAPWWQMVTVKQSHLHSLTLTVLLFQWKVVFYPSEKIHLCTSSRLNTLYVKNKTITKQSLVLLLACCRPKSGGGETIVKIQCRATDDVPLVFVSQRTQHQRGDILSLNLMQGIFTGSFHYYKHVTSLKQHRGMTGALTM